MNCTKRQHQIRKLLEDNNAILLVHYYEREEVQDIADILNDSLALSMSAAQTDADVIVFAGVQFMAESAAILSPEKTVLIPRMDAGCPLADTITLSQLQAEKQKYPDAAVVTYVNSSAEIKAHSDICCTSANMVEVVNALTGREQILAVPDGNIARYASRFTTKEVIPWKGYCPVHHFLMVNEIREVQAVHPGAKFAAHPECIPEVLDMADFVGSTRQILDFVQKTDAEEFIIGTEIGIMHELRKRNPGKSFIPASDRLICRDMKKITLDDILAALRDMKHVIEVPENVRVPANQALEKMLRVAWHSDGM